MYDKEAAVKDVAKRVLERAARAGGTVGGAAQTAGRAVGGAAQTAGRAAGGAAQTAGRAVGGAAQTGGKAVSEAARATAAKSKELGVRGLEWAKAHPKATTGILAGGAGTLGFAAGRGTKKESNEKIATALVGEWLSRRYGE